MNCADYFRRASVIRRPEWRRKPRRAVARRVDLRGELYTRARIYRHQPGASGRERVAFYKQRGTAEKWIKEGKGGRSRVDAAVVPALYSSHRGAPPAPAWLPIRQLHAHVAMTQNGGGRGR